MDLFTLALLLQLGNSGLLPPMLADHTESRSEYAVETIWIWPDCNTYRQHCSLRFFKLLLGNGYWRFFLICIFLWLCPCVWWSKQNWVVICLFLCSSWTFIWSSEIWSLFTVPENYRFIESSFSLCEIYCFGSICACLFRHYLLVSTMFLKPEQPIESWEDCVLRMKIYWNIY